jgi:hypothetical protein
MHYVCTYVTESIKLYVLKQNRHVDYFDCFEHGTIKTGRTFLTFEVNAVDALSGFWAIKVS